ncbi:unnamed protein product [Penicillium salamii]|nr:unnamed protein product [Penicillium salamii]
MARLLIDNRANVNASNEYGETPLQGALKNHFEPIVFLVNPPDYSLSNGHKAVARLLIDNGANFNTSDNRGWTQLHWASSFGREAVARFLIDNGANVNDGDKDGRTPLSHALSNGHEAVARLLIDDGANVNAGDKEGRTSLQRASSNGYEAMARLLVGDGAQLERRTSKQTSILHFLFSVLSSWPTITRY